MKAPRPEEELLEAEELSSFSCLGIGSPGRLVIFAAAMFLPIATRPDALAFATGRWKTSDFLWIGLAIDMVERARERMVWHGLVSQQTIDERFSDERARRAVQRLLEDFPPAPERKGRRP